MSIIDERIAAINDYQIAQERLAREGVRQAVWVSRGALVIAGAAIGATIAEITVNFDVLTASGSLMFLVAGLFAGLAFAAVEMARVTTRSHRAGIRRAAHTIAASRRYQQRLLAILNDPTLTS